MCDPPVRPRQGSAAVWGEVETSVKPCQDHASIPWQAWQHLPLQPHCQATPAVRSLRETFVMRSQALISVESVVRCS